MGKRSAKSLVLGKAQPSPVSTPGQADTGIHPEKDRQALG